MYIQKKKEYIYISIFCKNIVVCNLLLFQEKKSKIKLMQMDNLVSGSFLDLLFICGLPINENSQNIKYSKK